MSTPRRTIAGYSADLAGACRPARRDLVQGGVYAPEAVLVWAVGGDLVTREGEEATK